GGWGGGGGVGGMGAKGGVKPLGSASPVPPRRAAPAAGRLVFAVTGRDTAEIVEASCPAALILAPLRILQRRLEGCLSPLEILPVEIERAQAAIAVGNRPVVAEALLAQPRLLEELARRLEVVLAGVDQPERVEYLSSQEVVAAAGVQRLQKRCQGVGKASLAVVVEATLVSDAGLQDMVARVAARARLAQQGLDASEVMTPIAGVRLADEGPADQGRELPNAAELGKGLFLFRLSREPAQQQRAARVLLVLGRGARTQAEDADLPAPCPQLDEDLRDDLGERIFRGGQRAGGRGALQIVVESLGELGHAEKAATRLLGQCLEADGLEVRV